MVHTSDTETQRAVMEGCGGKCGGVRLMNPLNFGVGVSCMCLEDLSQTCQSVSIIRLTFVVMLGKLTHPSVPSVACTILHRQNQVVREILSHMAKHSEEKETYGNINQIK